MRKVKQSTLKAKADRLFSLKVREAGICLMEGLYNGCGGGLQAAHIKSRRYLCLRWDLLNAIPLCAAHHRYCHDHPDVFIGFISSLGDNRLAYLNARMQDPPQKVDYKDLINRLKGREKVEVSWVTPDDIDFPSMEPLEDGL